MAKEFLVCDESINRYGFRVLVSGGQTKNFKANPVGFFNHNTGGYSWNRDTTYKGPCIRWEGLRTEDGKMYCTPVFDLKDDVGKVLNDKVDDNFIRAASIGFKIIETSNDPELMLKGQMYPTVTKWELMEISVVDIPANTNALALFDGDGKRIELNDDSLSTTLSALLPTNKPIVKNTPMKYTLKAGLAALLTFLKITPEAGKDSVETEITETQLSEINDKLVRLAAVETEVTTLTAKKTELDGIVATLTAEKNTLTTEKAAEVTKVTDLQTQLTAKTTEVTTLTAEVTKLKGTGTQIKKAVKEGNDEQVDLDGKDKKEEGYSDVDGEARALAAKYGKPAEVKKETV